MKRKLIIAIDDLDDLKNVLTALDNLFRTLICYYLDNDIDKLNTLVMTCSIYFGKILGLLGYKSEDFGDQNGK